MALTTIQAVYDEARRALETGNDERAIGLSEHLLESFPHYLEAYRILGEAHLIRQELELAAKSFETVLQSDPENIPVHVGLGVTYERQGELQKAIQEFEQAFEIKPDLPDLRNQVLRLYGEAWGNENAHVRLKKAGLARLFIRGNQYEKAIQELQDVLNQQPERLDVHVALLEALWRNDQEQEAAEQARQILQKSPNVLKANLILGYVLLAAGDSEGKRLWQHAQQLDPSQGVAQTLFSGMLPPVESINTKIEEFDEQAWHEAKRRKAQAEQEAQERELREQAEREAQERAAQEQLVAEPVGATAHSGSWLDEIGGSRIEDSASVNDDFLRSLLLGATSTPSIPSHIPEPELEPELDFNIDDLGLDIQPFSFGDEEEASTEQEPVVADPLLNATQFDMPREVEDPAVAEELAEFEFDASEDNFDDIKPFSFDDFGDDLTSLPGMDFGNDQLSDDLQPFEMEDVHEPINFGQKQTQSEITLPGNQKPFSLDELSPESLDADFSPQPQVGKLPSVNARDTESGGFSWQQPGSSDRPIFERLKRQEEPDYPDGESMFNKMVEKKSTTHLEPLSEDHTSNLDLDDETMSFFSHDDVTLRLDEDVDDTTIADAVSDQAEQEMTPFSLSDLGLSDDEIASLDTDSPSDQAEQEMTPFSLSDLGLSDDEIASLDTDSPSEKSGEFEFDDTNITPFSFDGFDFGAAPDTKPTQTDTSTQFTEGDLEPFSMDDLNQSQDQGPALSFDDLPEPKRSADAIFETLLQLGEQKGFVDLTEIISCYDDPEAHAEEIDQIAIDLYQSGIAIHDGEEVIDMDEITGEYYDEEEGYDSEAEIEDNSSLNQSIAEQPDTASEEMQPFSLAELGLSPEEIETFDSDGDGDITLEDFGTPNAAEIPEPTQEQDSDIGLMTPFSLADLGLSPEEIATFDADGDGAITPEDFGGIGAATISDQDEMDSIEPFSFAEFEETPQLEAEPTPEAKPEPEEIDEAALMTPFSLADLGLSPEEIAMLNGEGDSETTELLETNDEPEALDGFSSEGSEAVPEELDEAALMTPFSLADLGLSPEEMAMLNGEDTFVEQPDETDVFGGTLDQGKTPEAKPEPEELDEAALMTPFSLADLGLSPEEIETLDTDGDGEITPSDFDTTENQVVSQTEEPEMTPFSLADLGLSPEEIASLDESPNSQDSEAEFDMRDVSPFSFADLGLSENDTFDRSEDDDRNLKLSDEELDSLDLALPIEGRNATQQQESLIEPGPEWQAAEQAVEDVVASNSLESFDFTDDYDQDTGPTFDTLPTDLSEPSSSDESSTQYQETGIQQPEPTKTPDKAQSSEPDGDTTTNLPEINEYLQQLQEQPDNHGLRIAIARMLAQTGDTVKALDEYKNLIKQGTLLEQIEEDLRDMINTQEDPSLLQKLHRTLGDAYSKQSRWREAMDEYGWVLNKR